MPRSLDLARLRQFEPGSVPVEPALPAPPSERVGQGASATLPPPERWPSREPVRDGQISIKAPLDVIERFRSLCHDDRRTYADMLGILMNHFDQQS
jgi:hypothetical protein